MTSGLFDKYSSRRKKDDTFLKISYLLYSKIITEEGESVKSDSEVMRFCEMS